MCQICGEIRYSKHVRYYRRLCNYWLKKFNWLQWGTWIPCFTNLVINVTHFFSNLYERNREIAYYSKAGKHPVNIILCTCKSKSDSSLPLSFSLKYPTSSAKVNVQLQIHWLLMLHNASKRMKGIKGLLVAFSGFLWNVREKENVVYL